MIHLQLLIQFPLTSTYFCYLQLTTPRRSRKKTNVDTGRNNNNNTAFSSSINGNNDQKSTQPRGNGDGFQQQLLTALNSLLRMNRWFITRKKTYLKFCLVTLISNEILGFNFITN